MSNKIYLFFFINLFIFTHSQMEEFKQFHKALSCITLSESLLKSKKTPNQIKPEEVMQTAIICYGLINKEQADRFIGDFSEQKQPNIDEIRNLFDVNKFKEKYSNNDIQQLSENFKNDLMKLSELQRKFGSGMGNAGFEQAPSSKSFNYKGIFGMFNLLSYYIIVLMKSYIGFAIFIILLFLFLHSLSNSYRNNKKKNKKL